MNEDEELQIVDGWLKKTCEEILSLFIINVRDFPDEIFAKYSSQIHVYLLANINTAIINGFSTSAFEADTDKMANPHEAFYHMVENVVELTVKNYLLKYNYNKKEAH